MNEITKVYIRSRIEELDCYIKGNKERTEQYSKILSKIEKETNEYIKEKNVLTEDLKDEH